jgi:hypothetical protein
VTETLLTVAVILVGLAVTGILYLAITPRRHTR